MSSSGPARAKELFLQALELAGGERETWLERLARKDPALAQEVLGLLRAHEGELAAGLERKAQALEVSGRLRGAPLRLGDHELLEEIGSGASGSVWRARQLSLGRIVALKVLRSGFLAGAKERERFRAEAAAVARLDHPQIVPVHEVGEHEGVAFFSMKWIEGGTLARHLERPWPARKAARLLADVARAVHHAHQRRLLHRDLKPSNVLLDVEGRPHVADFGIAKRLDEGAQATTTHALAGTPTYMAPEQAQGGELTVATDVWALGCILYELLAGRAAFGAGSVTEILHRVLREEPAPLRALRPELERDLETIVLVALQKEPARRYASADALAEDLERWLAHEPIAARRTRSWERLVLFARRSPLAATLIGVAASLVLLLAVVASWASVELGARLRDSYLGEARATRLAGGVGARATALDLLARAAAIRPGADLRDEAIACLASSDLERESSVERPPGLEEQVVCDPALERLAVGDERGLHVLRFGDGAELALLSAASDVRFLAWSPGGRWLLSKHHGASQRQDAAFRVWDVAAGALQIEREEAISARSADFAPDDLRLAYGTFAGEVAVLDLSAGEERLRFEAGAPAISLCFAPDGARLGVLLGGPLGGEGPRLELRDSETGALLAATPLAAEPFDLCWVERGRGLAVACADFRIYLFDEDASELRAVYQGHAAEVVELFACPDAPLLTSYSWDGTTRLWDVLTGRELRRISARSLGFARGLRLGLTDASSWSLWKIAHGDHLRVLRVHSGKAPRDLSFSPDGRKLASAGPDGVYLHDCGPSPVPAAQDPPGRRPDPAPEPGAPTGGFAAVWEGRADWWPKPVLALDARVVEFVDGGRALVACGPSGLWRRALEPRGEPEQFLAEPLKSMAVSADGRVLAAQGASSVHLFEPAGMRRLGTLQGAENMEYVTTSADGARVAAGNWKGRGVRLWIPRESDAPRLLLPEQSNVAVALSPDGELLATSSSGRLELWRTESGERIHAVELRRAFSSTPAPAAFSPDGTLLAFGLSDEIVGLIDTRSFESRGALEPAELAPLSGLCFSPDGSVLGAACSTNRVQLWDLAALRHELAALGLSTGR